MNRSLLFFSKIIASLFGIGYLRPFPATWGSAATGLVLYFFWPWLGATVKLAISTVVFLLGAYFASVIEYAEKLHDPSFIVIDEAVGMMIATLFLSQVWWQWVIAFLFFRIFDVLKPLPANLMNKKSGGLAIMLDDLIVGVYILFGFYFLYV